MKNKVICICICIYPMYADMLHLQRFVPSEAEDPYLTQPLSPHKVACFIYPDSKPQLMMMAHPSGTFGWLHYLNLHGPAIFNKFIASRNLAYSIIVLSLN